MNRFEEMIQSGIAKFNYVNITKDKPANLNCPCCTTAIEYNNLYGALTDTHMEALCDKGLDFDYIITGSMIRDSRSWGMFLNSFCWGGASFSSTLNDWFREHDLVGGYNIVNGMTVYTLKKKQ